LYHWAELPLSKRKYNQYTDKFKAGAVLTWEANPNFVAVAKHLSIPEATLRSWVNKHQNNGKRPAAAELDVEIYDGKKIDFVQAIENELYGIHQEMKCKREGADYRELAVAFGILHDKRQLLTGGATENVNNRMLIQYVNDWRKAGN
jgi:hypothetical protein